ncbi:DUF190 domain-containing protein [Streptomyces sp. NPDC029006]|uniref:DUF190 domain-containing protein n=1 Tax=Streptomyces sp. NPDC029006 TaxID=3155467 RepID=UPI0033F47ABD
MTSPAHRALRLTVCAGENDTWHHKPLHSEVVHRAHTAGLGGVGVFRGIVGFGASSRIHTSRLLSLSDDLPVAVVVVDTEERVRAFLPQRDELTGEALVTLEACEIVPLRSAFRPGGGGPAAGAAGPDTSGPDPEGKESL